MLHTFYSMFVIAVLLVCVSGCGTTQPEVASSPEVTPELPLSGKEQVLAESAELEKEAEHTEPPKDSVQPEVKSSSKPKPELALSKREQALAEFAELEMEAAKTKPPKPTITLPTLAGWSKSKPRPLPPTDHGFTVAYDHKKSGLTVTLYQFTRGLRSIPNDVNSAIIRKEMEGAKNGIEQVVQLGVWQAAKEIKSETVQLGNSQQRALWSQYELTVDGEVKASDIYVWAQANSIFKIRCTAESDDAESNQAVLAPLLTALGSAGAPAKK